MSLAIVFFDRELAVIGTDGQSVQTVNGETSAPDATNFHLTIGAGGPTAFRIFVEY